MDEYANAALAKALESADPKLLASAISMGADLQRELHRKQSPLHLAAALTEPDCLLALLAAGDDPNAQDEDGNTAIMAACFTGREKNIQALMANGADALIPNAQGQRSLELAIEIGLATAILPEQGALYGRIIAMVAAEAQRRGAVSPPQAAPKP